MSAEYQDGSNGADREPPTTPQAGPGAQPWSDPTNATDADAAGTTFLGSLDSAERPLHCLVFDSKLPMFQANSHVIWVNDSQREYDVLLLSETPRPEQLTKYLLRSGNPAAPIVTIGDILPGRADLVLPVSEPSSLSQALTALRPLIERVAQLPPLPPGLNRRALLALALAQTRDADLVPKWSPETPDLVHYPLLAGINDPREVLEQLSDSGLLQRHFFDRTYLCDHCQSSRLHPREVCVNCQSSELSEHHLMHHYACGFQAAAIKFSTDHGYHCPKCNKTLRHYGVDYDKPGQLVLCDQCDTSMSEPDVSFACTDCGNETEAETARQQTWYRYSLSGDAAAALSAKEMNLDGLANGWDKSGKKFGAHPMFRDFMLLTQSYAQIAIRCDRPLSALLLNIKSDVAPADQTAIFVADLIKETLRGGDLVTCVGAHIVALLPETAESAAQNSLTRIREVLAKNASEHTQLDARVLARGEILSTLRTLS